jgi:hypothetical protein
VANGHGGKRAGAGRKPGAAWVGKRPFAACLKSSAVALARDLVGSERDPLLVALDIASDPELPLEARLGVWDDDPGAASAADGCGGADGYHGHPHQCRPVVGSSGSASGAPDDTGKSRRGDRMMAMPKTLSRG